MHFFTGCVFLALTWDLLTCGSGSHCRMNTRQLFISCIAHPPECTYMFSISHCLSGLADVSFSMLKIIADTQ